MTDLCRLPATRVVELLRQREIAPREALDAVLGRVTAIDPKVNALPTLCVERAVRQAEAMVRRRGVEPSRLAGLPAPIKDSMAVSGVRTTWGSRVFADHVATGSDYCVEALERSGAVIFAKSNTPEFEAGANTFNEVFGATRNPWNTALSAAGSSGGAAVAVATGMAWIAQGSDFACSLRYPASFCGVVGLRPSPGLVPQGPSDLPWQTLSVAGPLARDVADIGLALDAMAVFDGRDPLSYAAVDAGGFAAAARAPHRPARLAASVDLGITPVDRRVARAFQAAVARIAADGVAVAEAHPDLSAAHDAFRPLRAYQFAALRAGLLADHRAQLKPEIVWNIEQGLRLSAAELAAAEHHRARLRSAAVAFLAVHEFLVTPTAIVLPFPVEQRYVEAVDGHRFATYLDWLAIGYAISVTGCPAISLPCGFTEDGLPIGLQIVAPPRQERRLLAVAAWVEQCLGAHLAEPIDPRSAE